MTVSCHRLAITVAVAIAIVAPFPAAAADNQAAINLVATAVDDVISTFAGKVLVKDEQARLFRAEIERFSDPRLLSAAILGRYWDRLSDAEKTEFQHLLIDYIVAIWGEGLSDVSASTKVDIRGTETTGDRIIVHTIVADAADGPSVVDWTVTTNGSNAPVIADIAADGISIIKTVKADFTAVLRTNGGQPDALFQAMRQKISKNQ